VSNVHMELAKTALEKSLEVREEYGYDFRSPLCVYELCDRAGIKVQFVDDVSMEGVYVASGRPKIIISALRPLARRAFTCAHECAHYFFGHGSTIDELKEACAEGKFQPEEFLADAFAGFLLMPAQGIKRAFATRGIDLAAAAPHEVYTVASSFGVGYETLIGHLAYSLKYIRPDRGDVLRKSKLPEIRETLLGFAAKEHLVIADRHHASSTMDAEVGNLVLLPADASTDSDRIEFVADVPKGRLFRALRPGLARAAISSLNWGVIVRVSRFQYAGLARYRHLEETDSD
jgi:hypothetical protein